MRGRAALRRSVSATVSVLLAVPLWLLALATVAAPAHGSSAGTVYLATVPRLAGVSFDVGGASVVTGGDGTAVLSLSDINGVASTVSLTHTVLADGTRVHIARIVPAAHIPHESHLSVGLDVTSPVRIKLLQGNSHVPPSHVTALDLHSIIGQRLKTDPRRHQLLHLMSRKIRYVNGTLQAQPVTWAVEGTTADPGISVTTSQPRLDPLRHGIWTVRLTPVAGTVRVTTVPRTSGVQFDIAGTQLTTGRNGIGVAPVADLNNVKDELTLASSNAGRYQVSALRVSKIPSTVLHQRRLTAAIDVRRGVMLRFVDAHSRPVPAARIGQVSFTAGSSVVSTLIGTELSAPALLLTRVADHVGTGWDTRTVTYSLRSVRINGANAVFAGRQRFTPQSGSTWTIQLSVFSVTLSVRDALTGSTIGTRTVITRPDGSRIAQSVSAGSPAVMTGMVRGLYTLKIDAAVLGGTTSILVSRNDTVELRVITLLDTVLIGVGGALLLPGVVLVGFALTRRSRRQTSESEA